MTLQREVYPCQGYPQQGYVAQQQSWCVTGGGGGGQHNNGWWPETKPSPYTTTPPHHSTLQMTYGANHTPHGGWQGQNKPHQNGAYVQPQPYNMTAPQPYNMTETTEYQAYQQQYQQCPPTGYGHQWTFKGI